MTNDSAPAKVSTVMPTSLHEALHRLAVEHDRSFSADLRITVRAHVAESGSSSSREGRGPNPDGSRPLLK